MTDKVYQVLELIGTSKNGIEAAIENAIQEAAKMNQKLDWYQVVETRGFIENQQNKYYQVHLKIGCNTE